MVSSIGTSSTEDNVFNSIVVKSLVYPWKLDMHDNSGWKLGKNVCKAQTSSFSHVHCVVAIVIHRWADVPAWLNIYRP